MQYEHQESEREQQRFVDARRHDSDADDENEEEDEEDSPQPAVARADPLPGERTVRRRVGPTREESRAEPVEERPTMEEPETEDAGVLFDPAEALQIYPYLNLRTSLLAQSSHCFHTVW